ncbi:MAG: hypothetical protein EXS06_00585 [Planctomycetaceae bacterium]|nr:hypothetical protein [Planctomycetaceae bacterium]
MHRHVSTLLFLAVLAVLVMLVMLVMAAPTFAAEEPLPLPLPLPPTIDDDAGWIDVAVPLPAVEAFVPGRVRLAAIGDPQDLQEPLLLDDLAPPGQPRQEFEPPSGRKLPPGAKPGMLQQAISTITELPKLGNDGLGLTALDQWVTLGLPAPTVDSPLLITPGFGVTLVDAPAGVDLPSDLYEGYIQARWLRKIGKRFGVDLAVAPGWYSDFHNDSSQSLRITGHGFGAWEATDNLRVVAGLIYLDRYDVNMLPAGGLVWTPADDQRFELIFPRPRLAWRFAEHPSAAHWSYLAAEFGGNQWAMQSAIGVDQVVVIRDYRLIAGWERKPADLGISWRLETGFVFGRTVQYYDSDTPTAHPGNTFMVRAGAWY